MKILPIASGLLFLGLLSGILSSCNGDKPSRSKLISLMEEYLDALAHQDPSGLPLAEDAILVENTEVTPIGDGLWKTATSGPASFAIYVADSLKARWLSRGDRRK
ncbi:MAG: hypothetical protein R2751_10145 [Bacteroidales bacterium]